MGNVKTYDFLELQFADLFVDALYKGGSAGNAGDDPISKLTGTGNQGGFRYIGSREAGVKLCVLYSSMVEPDWPDALDSETGRFIYFGDNRNPGHQLHDTKRKGNEVLRRSFDCLHSGKRNQIPPFLVFTKAPLGRDVIFRGLAVPGAKGVNSPDDLVAIWKSTKGNRFQNYRAIFTILDEPIIRRSWLNAIVAGISNHDYDPINWLDWRSGRSYKPLIAQRTQQHRSKDEQLPAATEKLEKLILAHVVNYFKKHPKGEYAFEKCAAEIVLLTDPNFTKYDLTRPWRDGGRDAIGLYRIGRTDNGIEVEFALEAKCKVLTSGSGIQETSRLISRLKHRQFGIFVTTSFVSEQAYKEILEDRHPIVIISGRDISKILINAGLNGTQSVDAWLNEGFPYIEK